MKKIPSPVTPRAPRTPAVAPADTPAPPAAVSGRDRLRRDRRLVQELERAARLLRKAIAAQEVAETTGRNDAEAAEHLARLRAGARAAAVNAIAQDARPVAGGGGA